MDQLLQIEDLRIRFKNEAEETFALKGIDLSIEKGQTLGIVGESGSGKSVTGLSILRLLHTSAERTSGQVKWKGTDVFSHSEEKMRTIRGKEIAMIFQEPMTSLNPVLSCGFQVAEALRLHKGLSKAAARAETLRLFEQVELPRPEKMLDAYPHEISGGQKQRVMIAMAISCEPELLIADEPTTALDVTVQKSVLQLLKKLQQSYQMSMIFISHDLGVVAEVCDQVAVMYKGEIVEKGAIQSVFEQPQHPYTQGLLACRPSLHLDVKRLPTVQDFLENKHTHIETLTDIDLQQRQAYLAKQPEILSVQNLKTYFPLTKNFWGKTLQYVKAVDDVTFSLKQGETLGLVGESGCGKTTLGRSILRLIEPTEGEVHFDGKILNRLSPKEMRTLRKEMQFIFQDPYSSLNPKICIGDAILEAMQVHHLHENDTKRKAKVKEWLERTGLSADHYTRYPHAFSGGQRQRICIARALALAPRFVICDESVSALDVSVQAQILNLLKSLQAEFHFSYIFISHDLNVVKFLSDKVAVMQNGKIVEYNHTHQLYASPQTDYTRTLLAAVPQSVYK